MISKENDYTKNTVYPKEKYLSKIRPFYHIDIVKVIAGIRRSGKCSILKSIISELEKKSIIMKNENLAFLNRNNLKFSANRLV